MVNKSNTTSEIIEVTNAEKVIELAQKGFQPKQIAAALELSRATVYNYMDKWLAETSIRLAEQAEVLHLIELSRLDYLYSVIAEAALPHYDETLEMMIPVDERKIELLLKIIKEKREWNKAIADAKRKDRDAPGVGTVNIDHIEVTISQTNPLYETANQNINHDNWVKYADMDVSDLYQIPGTVKDITEQIDEVGKYVEDIDNRLLAKDDDEQ